MSLSPHIVLAGGGRLGNVLPGLALAEHLKRHCCDLGVRFVGTGEKTQKNLVQTAGCSYTAIPSSPQPRSPLEGLRYVASNAAGFVAARWMLGEWKPSLVVCLGGSVSGVMAHAAKSSGTPFLLLEKDAIASGAARRTGDAAQAVCLAHEKTRFTLPATCPSVVTGTPVRDAFLNQSRGARSAEDKQLLILNGQSSRGDSFNLAVHQAVCSLAKHLQGWRIIHQTGDRQLEVTERRYQQAGAHAVVVSHIDQMPSLLAKSDLVVCRSGGSLLAELGCVGAPAILVPDPDSKGQTANARAVASLGAAVTATQDSPDSLAKQVGGYLSELTHDDLRRERMSQAARAGARPTAASDLAQLCAELLGIGPIRVAA